MTGKILRCSGVRVAYGDGPVRTTALRHLTFEVGQNKFLSVVGPSGSGKTSLLRLLAGLLRPCEGSVEFLLDEPKHETHWPLTSLVFQENSLFPWMTVVENAAFALEVQKVDRAERERSATELLARFGLRGRERDYPHQLSTGMKQRVAVIRAFLAGAPILLMDEPFAALDCQSRYRAQQELLDLWQQDRKTVVFVTHDVGEAIRLSDRILVLSQGPGTIIAEYRVEQPRPRPLLLEDSEEMLDLNREIFACLQLTQPPVSMAGAS